MATDDFNRADNADLGANWTIQSGQAALQIVSNRAVPSNNFSDCGEIWVADSFSDDQYSESVVTALHSSAPAETGIGPIVRGSTSVASYYAVVVDPQPLIRGHLRNVSPARIRISTTVLICSLTAIRTSRSLWNNTDR